MNCQLNPANNLVGINKVILKFIWETKDSEWGMQYLKEDKFWGLSVPDFKADYKSTAIRQFVLVEEWRNGSKRQNRELRNRHTETDRGTKEK